MKQSLGLVFATVGLILAGCGNPESGRRLRLPQGSAENGRTAFVELKCTQCHTVAGVDLPKPTVAPESVVELGGSVARVRDVGDLMTSIIHPTQSVSDKVKWASGSPPAAKMSNQNDTMTVSQLIDLVRFLQPRYTQMPAPMDWNYLP